MSVSGSVRCCSDMMLMVMCGIVCMISYRWYMSVVSAMRRCGLDTTARLIRLVCWTAWYCWQYGSVICVLADMWLCLVASVHFG